MSIKTIQALQAERDTAIPINGNPDVVRSAIHNPYLEDIMDSVAARFQSAVVEASPNNSTLNFNDQNVGSRGVIISNQTGNRTITAITGATKGDVIYLIVNHNSNNFSFNMSNLYEVGAFNINKAQNLVRITCVNDSSLNDSFIAEYLDNNSILNRIKNQTIIGQFTFEDAIIIPKGHSSEQRSWPGTASDKTGNPEIGVLYLAVNANTWDPTINNQLVFTTGLTGIRTITGVLVQDNGRHWDICSYTTIGDPGGFLTWDLSGDVSIGITPGGLFDTPDFGGTGGQLRALITLWYQTS